MTKKEIDEMLRVPVKIESKKISSKIKKMWDKVKKHVVKLGTRRYL